MHSSSCEIEALTCDENSPSTAITMMKKFGAALVMARMAANERKNGRFKDFK
jgi:hypothetical protein